MSSLCAECSTPLVRIKYAAAHECPECMAKERYRLLRGLEQIVRMIQQARSGARGNFDLDHIDATARKALDE
jgi:DNA-directed RNA polymerase subunit RPC12/RpoP